MSGNLFTGAGYFLRGLTMTFQPVLRRFVLIPLIANIVLFSLMGWLLYGLIVDFYEAAMLTVPDPSVVADRRADDGLCVDADRTDADLTFSRTAR